MAKVSAALLAARRQAKEALEREQRALEKEYKALVNWSHHNCFGSQNELLRKMALLKSEAESQTTLASGRLRILNEKAELATKEWKRAENAEGKLARAGRELRELKRKLKRRTR